MIHGTFTSEYIYGEDYRKLRLLLSDIDSDNFILAPQVDNYQVLQGVLISKGNGRKLNELTKVLKRTGFAPGHSIKFSVFEEDGMSMFILNPEGKIEMF